MGILAGTAWVSALIGAFLMMVIAVVLSPIAHEHIEWAWIFTFTLMGAVGGTLLQQAAKGLAAYNIGRSRRKQSS